MGDFAWSWVYLLMYLDLDVVLGAVCSWILKQVPTEVREGGLRRCHAIHARNVCDEGVDVLLLHSTT